MSLNKLIGMSVIVGFLLAYAISLAYAGEYDYSGHGAGTAMNIATAHEGPPAGMDAATFREWRQWQRDQAQFRLRERQQAYREQMDWARMKERQYRYRGGRYGYGSSYGRYYGGYDDYYPSRYRSPYYSSHHGRYGRYGCGGYGGEGGFRLHIGF